MKLFLPNPVEPGSGFFVAFILLVIAFFSTFTLRQTIIVDRIAFFRPTRFVIGRQRTLTIP
jgi:hypothetical protein